MQKAVNTDNTKNCQYKWLSAQITVSTDITEKCTIQIAVSTDNRENCKYRMVSIQLAISTIAQRVVDIGSFKL